MGSSCLDETTDPNSDLVPIHLDVGTSGRRIIDRFCWSLSENEASIENFARTLCADTFDCSRSSSSSDADQAVFLEAMVLRVTAEIQRQLQEHKEAAKGYHSYDTECLELIRYVVLTNRNFPPVQSLGMP